MRTVLSVRDWIVDHGKSITLILVSILLFSFFYVGVHYKINVQSDAIEPTTVVELESGSEIEQVVALKENFELTAINVMFGTYGRENQGEVKLSLFENDSLVEEWTIDSSELLDNSYAGFYLTEELKAKQGATYRLVITEHYTGANHVAVYVSDSADGDYAVDGENKQAGSICYRLDYNSTSMQRLLILAGVLLGAFAVVLMLLCKREVVVMSVMLFAALAAYMVVCPLGIAPDEAGHFPRAFEIANGDLLSKHLGDDGHGGNVLPSAISSFNDPNAVIDWKDTKEIDFRTLSLYAPVTYAPQALGIAITQIFTDNVSTIFYGGKIAHALSCFILCVLALRLIPFGRKLLFIVMLMPMTLHEMVSLAPDGFTIALCLVFLAYILHLAYSAESIGRKDIIILSVLGITISLCKIVYVVVLILLFMLPESKFNTRIKGIVFKIGLIVVAGALNLIWLSVSATYLVEFTPGVNSAEQVKFILSNVGLYYAISVRTLVENGIFYSSSMVGTSLGALNVPVTPVIWVIVVVLFVYETLTTHMNGLRVNKFDPMILFLGFIGGSALIFTSIYVQWTAVGSMFISGVQGRYFTPIIAMLAFSVILHRQKKLVSSETSYVSSDRASYSILIMLLVNSFALLDLIKHYYC